MKKLILCAAAAAALAGTGSVLAQPAECQGGIGAAYSGPECVNGVPQQKGHPAYRGNDYNFGYGNSGALLSQIFGTDAAPYVYHPAPRVAPRYQPSRRDRDGDGIRNRDDRYPNDPRYR